MMYYLKCERCGHYNPVDNPYRVYCEKCKTHLENNFIDWLNVNPDKDFEEFKLSCCVTEKEAPVQRIIPVQQPPKPQVSGPVLIRKKKIRPTKAQWAGIITVLVFAVIGTYFGKSAAKFVREKVQQAVLQKMDFVPSDTSEWKTFTFDEAGFSIFFPGEPKENIQNTPTEIGTLKIKMYSFEPKPGSDDNLVYIAGFTEYPSGFISDFMSEEQLETLFQNSVNGSVASVQGGNLVSVTEISYQEFPGREAAISVMGGQAIIKMRYYLVKNKMIITQVIVPAKNISNTSSGYFFNSFKLI